MFRIGEFAKRCRVSVRTLRFYEECGLLHPTRVDETTGYRHYDAALIPSVARIVALRDLGLSLEQIGVVVRAGRLSLPTLRAMLDAKRDELAAHVRAEQARLGRVESWLQMIEEGRMAEYEVVLKSANEQLVASQRRVIAKQSELSTILPQMFGQVFAQVGCIANGPCGEVWHDTKLFTGEDMDVETYVPISKAVPVQDPLCIRTLPAVPQIACAQHRGAFDGVGAAHEALHAWMHANGYRIAGPDRTVYYAVDPNGDPAGNLCEVQYPVVKTG